NMVRVEDVFVPEDMRVGEEGAGWKQVTTELAFERSGPERYLSSFALVLELIRAVSKDPGERAAATVGRLVAHLTTLRQMSLSVALMLEAGENPNLEAAVVKDVGTTFEQEVPEVVHALLGVEPTIDTGSDLQQVLGFLMQRAPSFSLRGGTREILRGIIARGLGLRWTSSGRSSATSSPVCSRISSPRTSSNRPRPASGPTRSGGRWRRTA